MILFFRTPSQSVIATEADHQLNNEEIKELCWLYGDATLVEDNCLSGFFVGPRREMITPWSTNAVEITQNMNLNGISRIEEYFPVSSKDADHDPMLQRMYDGLDQSIFTVDHKPEPIKHVDNLEEYNEQEGLALSPEEIEYLHKIEKELGRPLTDSEIFGFAQINSEHCRHKIFGGVFIIDGKEMESSLFNMIKKTTKENPHKILSAYKDNVAFSQGPVIEQFAPEDQSTSDYFRVKDIESVISLKAETHNFPTTVEPFNGAATGTGGEIRDRMGGGVGSWPIAGTAVYMTSYPRINGGRDWEDILPVRKWLYQTPEQILIKASNGASDFGNKFGQPLITGSVLTFEHKEGDEKYAYDKVIMLAGGVGYGTKRDCLKKEPQKGNKVVVVGGDNYRIGLGGGSVSSVDTGRYSNGIELNAVQRANPEMQKRAYNLVRALCEEDVNPVVSIHDHGSAGHVNCLSELVEECGGQIDMTKLPIGDKTLSSKEIIANESQERMGLLIDEKHIEHVRKIAERERAPLYVVGETTGDAHFSFVQGDGVKPFDLDVAQMFGHSPKTYMVDKTVERHYEDVTYSQDKLDEYLSRVLQLEAVACKDWLTNKVDRSVTGKIARQQCQGEIQLPLSDCGVVALDYRGRKGIATALGHAPQAGLASPEAGSVLSVAESLTNIVWAPLEDGLDSVSLSANWMWPCRSQEGEDARLYSAVKALSDFCCDIKVNVPTGKDSLSMSQQYPDGTKIISPGTVIVSSGGEVADIRKVVSPVVVNDANSSIYHIDFSFDEQRLGGSAFAQSLGKAGIKTVCYNFMPVIDWIRTDLNHPWPDGTTSLYFNKTRFAYFDLKILKRKHAEKDYSEKELMEVEKLGSRITGEEELELIDTVIVKTQGFVNGNIREGETEPVSVFRRLLSLYEGVDKGMLRENMRYFLAAVMPVCEKYGIDMCVHPDDPPFQMLGLPRIVTCEEDIAWILDAVDNPHNGLTFCAGSLSAGVHNDTRGLARRFAGRTRFVHLRSTETLSGGDFIESSHLSGRGHLIELIRVFESSNPGLPMRVDHGRMMLGDEKLGYNPGYSFHGRMLALAQVEGMMSVVQDELQEQRMRF